MIAVETALSSYGVGPPLAQIRTGSATASCVAGHIRCVVLSRYQALELIGARYGVDRLLPSYADLATNERIAAVRLRTELRQKESAPILQQLQQ